jgi:hypothetical protein
MLIAEEYGTHNCKRVVDYKIEGNILWLNDGDKWYPRKLMSPKRNQLDFKHGDDSTEPNCRVKDGDSFLEITRSSYPTRDYIEKRRQLLPQLRINEL